MRRIGIFCFHDKEGIVDEYVEFLLQELCHCLDYLVIVINGVVNDKGKFTLEKYADNIYIRENMGFDGGAYKDVIINLFGWHRIKEFDELILCNDTFYGPFVSFESVFDAMKNDKADFWGLNYYQNNIANHLQSYFLVFRSKILKESKFVNYFNRNIYLLTSNINDVYAEFELGLFCYLVDNGYNYGVYSKPNPYNIYQNSSISLREYNLPILKKKVFGPEHFVRATILDALKYLNQNKYYNVDLIINNVKRVYDVDISKEDIMEFDPGEIGITEVKYNVAKIDDIYIKSLILRKKCLYIYGVGVFSSHISKKIDIYKGKIDGYIVSDDQFNAPTIRNGIRVYKLSDITDYNNITIIVALNKEHTKEVKNNLKNFKEVIFLW